MEFRRYQHVERFGTQEVEGIEFGECYVFPKIDGTNASVWIGEDNQIHAGSRRRELSLDSDNAGFFAFITEDVGRRFEDFFSDYPHLRLYGEWLVPHSLKTYRESAWRKFYVFDVMDGDEYLPFEMYNLIIQNYNIDVIPPICKINSGSYEQFVNQLAKNTFLIEDGKGQGEGIVIKRYDYRNKYGRIAWAKIVTSEFKEKHSKVMGCGVVEGKDLVEKRIVDEFLTKAMIEKVYAKISVDGWSSKMIPRLLNTCYYDLVKEESWNFVKKFKSPTINFKTLQHFTFSKVKEEMDKLF